MDEPFRAVDLPRENYAVLHGGEIVIPAGTDYREALRQLFGDE